MLRQLTIVAAVAAALGAGGAGAAPAPRLAAVQAWVTAASAWVGRQQTTFVQEERTFVEINAGAAKALAFARDGKAAEGAAWAQAWAPARRLQLAALRGAAHQAGSAAPPLPAELSGVEQLKTQEAALRAVTRRQDDIIRTGLDVADQIVELSQKAAAGDAEAARTLFAKRLELAGTMLQGENVLIEASVSTLEEHDPQADIGRAAISGNLAMIAFLDAQKSAAASDAAGLAAAARRMREHAVQMQAAAAQAPTDATLDLTDLKSDPGLAHTRLGSRVEAAVGTLNESAQVEAQIADILLTVAGRLEKGEPPSSPQVQEAMGGMTRLVQRRIDLDLKRKRILAGQAP